MKDILKYTSILFVILLLSISVYYFYEVGTARNYTSTVICEDLQEYKWRTFNGVSQKFKMSIHDLKKHQLEILLKVQDPGFYNHKGIDLTTPGAGLTTITQALVKKLYFKNFKSGIAKIKQSLIARLVVNNLISKEDQITLFLNMMYFGKINGKPIVGFQSAAHAYFQKDISSLNEDQYISLIAMLVMPSTFHILNHPDWNKDRSDRIKSLISGSYKPKCLMDQFYGPLASEIINASIPKCSYFSSIYKNAK